MKSATFEIRNHGDEPFTPMILFFVGHDSEPKLYFYKELAPGHKLIKTEQVNIEIPEPDEPTYITASLQDKDTQEEIDKVNMNYIAR